jgi:glycosyltransferase involved in cell wall biosynthesis
VLDIIGNIQDENYHKSLKGVFNIDSSVSNIYDILSDYSLGLCTSKSESGPLVVLEYFISGIPFLSLKTGGVSEILYNYIPECFMDDLNFQSWVDRILFLESTNFSIPKELIKKVIKKEFDREEYKDRLIKIYEEIR